MESLSLVYRPGISKHAQISSVLRKNIRQGVLSAGQKLQPERELAGIFGCSTMTVRQALEQLMREGLIAREVGRGTFVREARPPGAAVVFDFEVFTPYQTHYYACLVGELQSHFKSRGWECGYYGDVTEGANAQEFEDAISARRFDGVVVSSKWIAAHDLKRLREADMQHVGVYPMPGLDYWVAYDMTSLGWRGAAALAEMGRKRVALIHQFIEYQATGDPVWGFETALLRTNVPVDRSLMRETSYSEESGYRAFLGLWAENPRPDGIVVTDEFVMRGVLRGMIELGTCDPEQLMVASHTSMDDCEYPFPVPVIQLRSSPAIQAQTISRMLIDLVEDTPVERPKVLLQPTVYNPFIGAEPSLHDSNDAPSPRDCE